MGMRQQVSYMYQGCIHHCFWKRQYVVLKKPYSVDSILRFAPFHILHEIAVPLNNMVYSSSSFFLDIWLQLSPLGRQRSEKIRNGRNCHNEATCPVTKFKKKRPYDQIWSSWQNGRRIVLFLVLYNKTHCSFFKHFLSCFTQSSLNRSYTLRGKYDESIGDAINRIIGDWQDVAIDEIRTSTANVNESSITPADTPVFLFFFFFPSDPNIFQIEKKKFFHKFLFLFFFLLRPKIFEKKSVNQVIKKKRPYGITQRLLWM